jgi:hypothetical protein
MNMNFLKSQAKGVLVGLAIVTLWAAMDWLAQIHGYPMGKDRSYFDTFFGAVAGSGLVFYALR